MALLGGLAEGFKTGSSIGLAISDRRHRAEADQQAADRQDMLDQRYQDNVGRQQANANRNYDLSKQQFDLTSELKGVQIKAAKSKAFSKDAGYVSHMLRSAMAVPDGSRPLSNDEFDALPAQEKLRRMDIIDKGAQFFANQGGLGKAFLGSHPDVDSKHPVKSFELMQNSQGEKGMLVNLNRKDGAPAALDYPQRRTGEKTVLPIGAFSKTLWDLSGAFGGGDLTKREEVIARNKNATGLENLRHSNKMTEQGGKPRTKTEMRKNMEYLVSSGVAKNEREARKLLLQSKSNPTKMVMDAVSSTEENQMLMNIKPGDSRYKDRGQIISDAMDLLDQINGRTSPQQAQAMPEQPAPQAQPAPQQTGGLPPQAASQLQEGAITRFGNGQAWTLKNGQPVQVQ